MGRVVHFEIPAEHPGKSLDFYKNAFGWTFQKWGEQDYWLFETGQGKSPGINGALIKRQDHFQSVVNTISVDSIDGSIKTITDSGGQVLTPVMDLPNIGKIAYFRDPDGNTFGIIEEAVRM
jgi:predicted enzyme related to lactoylglutathione lyase